jgi:hypothetical protein
MRGEPLSKMNPWQWVVIFSGVLILLALILLSNPVTRDLLNSNEGAVAAVLSALLVILYFGQAFLFHRQTILQNRPHVEIEKMEIKGSELEVWLSNLGNGVATDVEIESTIQFSDGKKYEPSEKSWRLRKVGETGSKKKRVGNSLKEGAKEVKFVGKPVVGLMYEGENRGYGLEAATRQLADDGVKEVELEFFVSCSDLLDNQFSESILGTAIEVDLNGSGMNLEEIRSKGRPSWETI